MARWYNKNSKAIGDGNDVRTCARGFSEASRSMLEARPKAARFERGDDGTAWESDAAEDLRQKMEELPELMRRFAAVMIHRLQNTRIRLLDVYGDVAQT